MIFLKSITEAVVSKKVVISGYYGFKNFGDELILSILTEKLKNLNAEITVFSSDPDWSRKNYDINAIKSFDLKNVIKTIKNSDVLISGGGSLLQDATSLKSLVYYSLIIFIALCLKKKVIIFAQGIGPINNLFAQKIVFTLLKKCDYLSVRDEKSHALLTKNGISSDLVCDPAFTLPDIPAAKELAVGIQLRSFKTMNSDFIKKLADITSRKFPDKKIIILPFQAALDNNVCEEFIKELKLVNPDINAKILYNVSYSEIINAISKLEYLIAMRFHALVIGLKYGVKSLGINYDQKVEKLALEAGIPVISLDNTGDFEDKFEQLLTENQTALKNFAHTKYFNWDKITEIVA